MNNYLLIHLYNDFSGSPRVLKNLSGVLNGLAHTKTIALLTSNGKGILDDIECDKRLSYTYYPRDNIFLKLLFYIIAQFSIFSKTVSFLFSRRKDKNVLVINTMLPFGAAFAKLFFPSTKVVYYLHETYINPPLLKWFLLKVIKCISDKNIYVSNYVKIELGFDDESGETIYNSVDSSFIRDVRLKDKANQVLFLSSLVRYKGVDNFIELAKLSYNTFNESYTYIMVMNCKAEEFERYVLQNGIILPSNISVVFRPSNISDYYLASKFVINLTDHHQCIETFGLTLVEGLCNGAIPIAPNYGGPKEILSNKTCMLYDDIDLQAILEFISRTEFDCRMMNKLIEDSKVFQYEHYQNKIKSFFIELHDTQIRRIK